MYSDLSPRGLCAGEGVFGEEGTKLALLARHLAFVDLRFRLVRVKTGQGFEGSLIAIEIHRY